MIQSETELRRRSDARISRLSKQVLLLLSERGVLPLDGLGGLLNVSAEQAGMAVGWLVRSRVVESHEDDEGRLTLRIHGPFA
jgi:hypothetical protein